MQIYIAKHGQQTGPFSVYQIKSMLDSNMITVRDSAWHDGLTEWRPLHEIVSFTYIASQHQRFTISRSTTLVSQDTSGLLPASFGIRLGAHVIDFIVNQIAGFIIGFIIGIILGETLETETIGVIGGIAGIVANWLYYALMESSPKQATLGKMACGLLVTNLEGQRIGFGQASGRYFGMFISGLTLLIGFLMCAWTEKKQCLHDMMAGCLVLQK
jgi:uncharacterized RDD family membrane protein YckC